MECVLSTLFTLFYDVLKCSGIHQQLIDFNNMNKNTIERLEGKQCLTLPISPECKSS